jgi:hypothetical protein
VREPLTLRIAAALLITFAALALYRSTLLPGVDLGDTASFQAAAGSPVITPRDGYPLYFAIGRVFVWLIGGDRAHAMNVASAVQAALACGVILLVASELAGSILAGAAAAVLFAGSYTFWSQAVIAEVYALHVLLIGASLFFLLHWSRGPTTPRLALFFGTYALSFGNHLSMVLLAPAFALFVAGTAGWRTVFSWRTISLALIVAACASLQYAWNFQSLWLAPHPPASLVDAARTFWFDVTKSDWRDTMVLRVPGGVLSERFEMYRFDLAQQFGWILPPLAAAGAISLARTAPARAVLIASSFAATWAFAFGYNVGDPHVFFLPSHLMLALLAAPGIAALDRATPPGTVAALVVLLVAGRIYGDHPALDRSEDRRPLGALEAVTAGIDHRNEVLITDLNWQLQNGLAYFAAQPGTRVAYARMADVRLYLPAFVRDNLAIGREVVLAGAARQQLDASYGPLFPTVRDPRARGTALADLARGLPRGTRYVLCVLEPTREFPLDPADLERALVLLTGTTRLTEVSRGYTAVAGVVGAPPTLVRRSDRPFRTRLDLAGVPVEIRMESWLAFDTIRRMGFGHVIAGRRHSLILERGVSFAALDDRGRATRTGYASGIYAPQDRYVIQR